ncbi:MAG TPA: hypothetical protein ENJ32_08825, partial [Crenotrichaceae bacterium]|nr:hypothetical protein [Crenotrichaceae bacterium]
MAGTIIALAIIITLLRIGLFLLNQNPSLLTQRLSQSLGKTVHIGGLHAQLHYFQPEILLDNVVIFDQTGQHILSFKQGLVRLNILPLVTTGKIQPTLLAADHAQLSLQKDQQGKIMLVGFGGDGDFFSSMIKSGSYYLMNS